MNLFIKYIVIVLFAISSVIFVNYQYPDNFKYVNNKIIDLFFNSDSDIELNDSIVVIDIDDKSINKLGQWPWSRNQMAQLVQKLNKYSPAVIGFSIIFSESDRTSPSNFMQKNEKGYENYDETFGLTIEDSDVPVVLGYTFLDSEERRENHIVPYVPAVYKNTIKDDTKINFFRPPSALLNIPLIQDSSYSSGFLNTIQNKDGRIVSMPMLMFYKDQLLPSLALELIRTVYQKRKIYLQENDEIGNYIELEKLRIPLDNLSSMLVKYTKEYKKIKHISAVDILEDTLSSEEEKEEKELLKNKIILIGSNATGISTHSTTPFKNDISSLDIQALMIENILSNNYLIQPSWEKTFNYISVVVISMLILSSMFYGGISFNVVLSLSISIISYFVFIELFNVYGYMINMSYVFESILLSLILSIIVHFVKNKEDMQDIRGKFASKVSKQVMEDLLDNSKKKGDLSSKRKNVTIFFSDIKSFTKITEKINDPHLLTKFINRYMDTMTKNIMISGGTVDKFMGDAIMAYWNAPYEVENHSDKALTSALEQIELLNEINEINLEEKMPLIQIRIGINAGEVFVGEVGGELRSDYTIMGKNVNHAAVLEQAGKYYGANVIISQSVKDNLQNDYVMMLVDIMQVDGTSDAFNIYQVFSIGTTDILVSNFIEEFERAIQYYRTGDIDNAILMFRHLLLNDNLLNKKLCNIYVKRCEEAYEDIKQGKYFNYIQTIDKSFISS